MRITKRPLAIGLMVSGGLLASALFAATALAVVNDSGNRTVEVPDKFGYATATTIEGATVEYIGDSNVTFGSSGSGVFNSFVRVQSSPAEKGYNTDGTLEFNTSAGSFTHSIKVSQIPVVKIGGVDYWELFADINDGNGQTSSTISLTDLEIYFTGNPSLTGYSFGVNATKVYDFEGDIKINDVNQGSGRGDLRYRIPTAALGIPAECGYFSATCNTYFVLYSGWGIAGTYASDGGFEEWKVKQYPTIELKKVWVGAGGQTTLNIGTSAGGSQVDFQQTGAAGAPPLTTGTNIVHDGTFYVSETGGLTGYTSTLACTRNGTAFTPGATGSVVFASPANKPETNTDNVICTFTNTVVPPKLHLRKVVVNDNGGTATVANFTLTANGTGANDLSGTSPVDSGPSLLADTWTLSETKPANYTASDWVCVGGNQGDATHITVGNGGEATCTITNNDNPPKLTLNKVVVNDNGGTALESAWTLTATGNPATDPATLSGPGAAGSTDVVSGAGFDAGVYDLSESAGPANYTASTWSCTGGQTGTQAKVTVALGDDITCTITNNDNPPSSKITPTDTTCQMYVDGTAATLSTLEYSLKGSTISQVNPGVFFYWMNVPAVQGSNTFSIVQAITTANFATFFDIAAGSFVYNGACAKVDVQSITQSGATTTVSFTAPTAGVYIIGVKYDPHTVVDQSKPTGANTTVHYDFSIASVPLSTSGLDLVKKPK